LVQFGILVVLHMRLKRSTILFVRWTIDSTATAQDRKAIVIASSASVQALTSRRRVS